MASASSLPPEELCYICMDVFTDPISTPCGHNYCKACITHYWDTSVDCCCPLCNTNFCNRPEFSVNKVLSETVDQFRSSRRSGTNPEPAKPNTLLNSLKYIERSQAEVRNVIEEKQKSTEKQAEGFIKEKKISSELKLSHDEDHIPVLIDYWAKVSVHPFSYVGTVGTVLDQPKKTRSKEMEKQICEQYHYQDNQPLFKVCNKTTVAHASHSDEQSEMVDQFRSSKRSSTNPEPAKPDEVSCDSCTEPIKLKALKSCLVCLASYCETHLEPHLRATAFKRHKLINPVKNLEDIMCQKHDRPLELFCKTDLMCVCQFCTQADHKSHQIVSLKEAYDSKKAELGKTEAEVQQMIRERQVKIHEVERSVVLSKKAADREIADSVKVFTALISCIERSQAEVRNVIEEKQKSTEKQAEGFIKELQQEITQFEKRSSELKKLSHAKDHIQLLQNFKPINLPVPIKDWTKVSVHPSSYVGTLGTVLDKLKKTLSKEMDKQIRDQPVFKDRNKTTVAHSNEQSAGTVPRVISAHTQGSVATQSTVRVQAIVKSQTFGCHRTLLQRVRQLGGLHVDETDSDPKVVIVFCQVKTHHMTDIEAAMKDVVPGGAAVILVIMHHTQDINNPNIVRTLGGDCVWDFVNVLYHETVPGLQPCAFNEQAVVQLRGALMKHSSVVGRHTIVRQSIGSTCVAHVVSPVAATAATAAAATAAAASVYGSYGGGSSGSVTAHASSSHTLKTTSNFSRTLNPSTSLILDQYHYQDNQPVFKDRNKTTAAHASHSDEQSAGTVPRVISAHTQGSVAAQSVVRVKAIVKGQTFDGHRTLLQRVRQLGGLHVDESDSDPNVVIVFCPVASCHMTDIEAAMKDVVPGGAAVILVVMHHTHNVDYSDIVRTLGGDCVWDFVNVLYHETVPGLLTCACNELAVAQLHGMLLKHSSVVSPVAATAAAATAGSSGKTKGGGVFGWFAGGNRK